MSQLLNAVIIDDEPLSRKVIRELIERFTSGIHISGEAGSAEEAVLLIQSTRPDLVFLDIEMPRCNGFSLLEKFTDAFFEVIFITSHHQYMQQAIRARVLDYLLKPIDIDELEKAINRAKDYLRNKSALAAENNNDQPCLTIHHGDEVRLVHASDIIAIENKGSYSLIQTASGEQLMQAKTIGHYESLPGFASCFLRIHRGILINTSHIHSYTKTDPCFIAMSNGLSYEVARRKKHEILQKIKH